jgi:hypothetical protein
MVATATQAQDHAPRQEKTKTSSVRLGDKVILIPDPVGFEEATSQFPKYKDRVVATEGPDNDALLAHLLVADCELMRNGSPPKYEHYTKVSVLRAARELTVTSSMMTDAVASFRKNAGNYLDPNGPTMKSLAKKAERGLTEVDARETKLDFTQTQHLGEFGAMPDVHSFLLLMTVRVSAAGGQATVPMLASLSFVRVNQRIIYVYVFKRYRAEADIEEIKQFTTKWATEIVAANKPQ